MLAGHYDRNVKSTEELFKNLSISKDDLKNFKYEFQYDVIKINMQRA